MHSSPSANQNSPDKGTLINMAIPSIITSKPPQSSENVASAGNTTNVHYKTFYSKTQGFIKRVAERVWNYVTVISLINIGDFAAR